MNINDLENMGYEERLNKIKGMNKKELKELANQLGKGVKPDVHTINTLIANRYCYKKLSGKG